MKLSTRRTGILSVPVNTRLTRSLSCVLACLLILSFVTASGEEKAAPPVLISVSISPEARVKASIEVPSHVLQQGQWADFTVTIDNAAGITAPLIIETDQLMTADSDTSRNRWLRIEWDATTPLTGAETEDRQLRLWSRDAGTRSAVLNFNAGQGTQDLGFRSDVLLTLKISKSKP